MVVLWNIRLLTPIAAFLLAVGAAADVGTDRRSAESQAQLARIGRSIFLDTRLSNPPGQACVSCHSPESAFADPRPVSPGAVPGRTGHRNAPSLMYAALIPNFAQEDLLQPDGEQIWVWQGGLFQDGRARTLDEQIGKPFLNPDEMNVGSLHELAAKLRTTDYAGSLRAGMSDPDWADDDKLTRKAFRSLVEFLKEPMFRPFDSRLDDHLAGKADALTEQERRGLAIFTSKAKCADCHLLTATVWTKPLLSDFGYDNLGAPSRGAKDDGLGGHTGVMEELGQFRAPSLRNVALTAPYLHNGSIATLREVVEFYNRRDLEPDRWGATDHPETVNHEDLGNLGLSDSEIDDLVAFMGSFTDRSLIEMKTQGQPFPLAPEGTPDSWSMRAYFPDWTHAAKPLPPNPRSTSAPLIDHSK